MPKLVTPLAQRFWSKVRVTDGCWEWGAGKMATGYGAIGLGPRGYGVGNAHRVSYMLANGAIPNGVLVLHGCDNRGCVNPDHLYLGDYSRNLRDAYERGGRARRPKGETHHRAKVTEADVRDIRHRYAGGQVTQAALGIEYGIGCDQVSRIVNRHVWAHVKSTKKENEDV